MVNKLNMCKVMLNFGVEGLQKIYQANVNHVDISRNSGITNFRFLSGYSQNELKKALTEYQTAFDSFKKLDNVTAKLSFYIGSRNGKERIQTEKKVMCSYQGCDFHHREGRWVAPDKFAEQNLTLFEIGSFFTL